MSILEQITTKIIKEQELVIGPLAWSEAGKVHGLKIVDQKKGEVTFEQGEDQKDVIDHLVGQYEHLFGRASHEVCREAVASILAEMPAAEIPLSLQA